MDQLTLSDFLGDWSVDRDIVDHLTGSASRFVGRAVFDTAGWYREMGQMILPDGATLSATRAYHWAPTPDGFAVTFEDGRPFHQIQLTAPRDRHHCDPDIYDVSYDFAQFPVWTAHWRVKGPRKDYDMTTRYRKQARDALATGGRAGLKQ